VNLVPPTARLTVSPRRIPRLFPLFSPGHVGQARGVDGPLYALGLLGLVCSELFVVELLSAKIRGR